LSHSTLASLPSFRIAPLFPVLLALALATASPLLAEPAAAQQETSDDVIADQPAADEGWSVKGGVGLTENPDTFLLNFEAQRTVGDWLAVGPMVQLGFDDDWTFVAPTLNATIRPFHFSGEGWERIVPYGFAGAGIGIIDNDDAPNDKTSVGFLIDLGTGLEFRITERVYLGSQVMFNFLPQQTSGQKFFFSWQVAGLRYAF
jgi:hypothetical protein